MLVVGAAIVVYTRIDARLQQQKQDELLADWSAELRHWETPGTEVRGAKSDSDEVNRMSDIPPPEWQDVDGQVMLGSVIIPSIGLEEPIIRGADEKTLLLGAGAVVESRLPGQAATNFVLASHRSRTFGKHFNRLNELKPGDAVDIDTSAGTYRYIVKSAKLVLPDDLSVLENEADASTLTLITCHPKRNPTHRLIVKAELQQ